MTKLAAGALLPSLAIDRSLATPVGAQLARALRALVHDAVLRPGDRLPSSRTLAAELGLSRTTVVDVYDQLAAEGLIASRVGDGAYVSAAIPAAAAPPTPRRPARLARLAGDASARFFPRIDHPAAPRAFVTGTPAYDAFPLPLWSRIAARALRGPRAGLMRYPDAAGLPELREAIAAHLRLNRGILCTAAEVFVFQGAQDAFTRIAALLLDPGDPVWFEDPGHIGARNAFLAAGARLVPVPVDGDGLDVAAGLLAAPDFRLAFVTPAHQQPLAVSLSGARRHALLAAADAADAWIVEDDAVGELAFSGRPAPPLRTLDGAGRVILVGSFAKSLFPGLRLGYALVPPNLAGVFERLAGAALPPAPAHEQATLAAFIAEGHFAVHIRRMRMLYAERHAALLDAAERRLPGLAEVRPVGAGLATVALLPEGTNAEAVVVAAAARGVTATPVARFALGPTPAALVLGFAAVPPRQLASATATLADVLAARL